MSKIIGRDTFGTMLVACHYLCSKESLAKLCLMLTIFLSSMPQNSFITKTLQQIYLSMGISGYSLFPSF